MGSRLTALVSPQKADPSFTLTFDSQRNGTTGSEQGASNDKRPHREIERPVRYGVTEGVQYIKTRRTQDTQGTQTPEIQRHRTDQHQGQTGAEAQQNAINTGAAC